MPELPEVETVRRHLAKKIVGRTIKKVRIKSDTRLCRDTVSPAVLRRRLPGKKIAALERRGKYLLLRLDSGELLVIHLGMTGNLFVAEPNRPSPAHTHLRLSLGDLDLVLLDPRTFGRVFLIAQDRIASHPALSRLGPEPLSSAFTTRYLERAFQGRKAPVKALLLDQSVAAGVGNIYADEANFRATISPRRPAGRLSSAEIAALRKAIRVVLRESIAAKGTTFRDYRWDAGKRGGFLSKLRVYGREGHTCQNCGNRIKRETVAGRSTFFCPHCQV